MRTDKTKFTIIGKENHAWHSTRYKQHIQLILFLNNIKDIFKLDTEYTLGTSAVADFEPDNRYLSESFQTMDSSSCRAGFFAYSRADSFTNSTEPDNLCAAQFCTLIL